MSKQPPSPDTPAPEAPATEPPPAIARPKAPSPATEAPATEAPPPESEAPAPSAPSATADILRAASLLLVLPISGKGGIATTHSAQTEAEAARAAFWFPLIGAKLGLALGLVWGIGWLLSGSTLVASALAVGAALLLTGALHEDGLADTADAWMAGATRHTAALRDPRLGTGGTSALALSLILRIALLATANSWGEAVGFLVISEAVSRAALGFGLASNAQAGARPTAAASNTDGGLARAWRGVNETTAWRSGALALALGFVAVIFGWVSVLGWGFGGAFACAVVLAARGAPQLRAPKGTDLGRDDLGGDALGTLQQLALVAALLGLAFGSSL